MTTFNHTPQRGDTLRMTDAAITEFLAAFSRTMLANPYIRVVEVTRERLLEGLALYKDRPDSVLLSALA